MRKRGLTTLAVVAIVAVILAAGGFGYYYYYIKTAPKPGWAVIRGCVAQNGKEVNYQFYGKKDWQLMSDNLGCGQEYTNAQSFGLKNQQVGEQITDVTQITVLLFDQKPTTYDEKSLAYFDVPGSENLFLELGKIAMTSNDTTIGISDTEWEYLKKSFKFK